MEKRIKSMSEAKARLVLAALSNGKTLNQICGGRLNGRYTSGEKITDYRLYQNYCADHPDFSREAQALLAENMKASNARKGARLRNRTHCKHGHPFSGKNLYISPDGKERRCWACMTRNGNTRRRMSEQQARRVVEALNDGKTIANITAAGKPSYILNHRALLLFRQKHPKFDRIVVRLSTANAKVHHAEASARRAQILRAHTIAEHGADIFTLIRAAVPGSLPAQIRDDVIGAMGLELVEGKLRPADIRKRVREFVTAQYRQFSKFGPLSLDARLYDDGTTTLGDTITRGLWD
jgi:hypothetical protein